MKNDLCMELLLSLVDALKPFAVLYFSATSLPYSTQKHSRLMEHLRLLCQTSIPMQTSGQPDNEPGQYALMISLARLKPVYHCEHVLKKKDML